MPRRILLTQLRRIGDVVLTTPVLRALRKAYPQAHLAYLTEAPADEALRGNPHVDQVHVLPRGKGLRAELAVWWRLRRERFDLVVDCFGSSRSALLTRFTGAPRRIGFNFRGRRVFYTDAVAMPPGRRYAAEHKALLLAPLGLSLDTLTPEVFPDAAACAAADARLAALGVGPDDLLVGLCPVSRQPYKVWPAERFAAVADHLVGQHGARVLFFRGPGEEGFVAQVRSHMRHAALPDYPVPGLMEMAALLARCHLLVGNDNGPRHFAIAVGTPTVGIFGRTRGINWTPPDNPAHHALEFDPGCKSACTYPDCKLECLEGTPVAAAVQAVDALLGLPGTAA